jgi:hypothetical protein
LGGCSYCKLSSWLHPIAREACLGYALMLGSAELVNHRAWSPGFLYKAAVRAILVSSTLSRYQQYQILFIVSTHSSAFHSFELGYQLEVTHQDQPLPYLPPLPLPNSTAITHHTTRIRNQDFPPGKPQPRCPTTSTSQTRTTRPGPSAPGCSSANWASPLSRSSAPSSRAASASRVRLTHPLH